MFLAKVLWILVEHRAVYLKVISLWIFFKIHKRTFIFVYFQSVKISPYFFHEMSPRIFINSSLKQNAASQLPSFLLLKILLIHRVFIQGTFISFFFQGKCSTWIFIWNNNPPTTIPFTSSHENSSYSQTFIFNNLHFILQSREMQHVNFHLKQKSTYHNSLHFFAWKFFLFTKLHFQQSSFHSSFKGNVAREFSFETTKIHLPQFPSLFLLKILLIHKVSFSTIFILFFSQEKCSTWIFIWNKNSPTIIPFTSSLEISSYSKDFYFK